MDLGALAQSFIVPVVIGLSVGSISGGSTRYARWRLGAVPARYAEALGALSAIPVAVYEPTLEGVGKAILAGAIGAGLSSAIANYPVR